MQIPINKDVEDAFKNEVVQGLTLREAICLIVSGALILGVTVLVWWKTGLSPDTSVFVGLPFGLPTLFIGFKKYQGLSLPAYLKEILYEHQTRILTYDADELPQESHVFTMESGRKKKGKRW